MGIIYKAVNLINGKVYVGQTKKSLECRLNNHKSCFKNGYVKTVFQSAMQEYGFDNFIFEKIDSEFNTNELDKKERYWIDFYKSNSPEFGYNIQDGGKAGFEPSEKLLELNALQKKENHPWWNRNHTEASKEKMSKSKTGNKNSLGRKYSKSTILKMKNSKLGMFLGEKNPNVKITEEIAKMIKIDLKNKIRNVEIVRKYGVTRNIVSHIKSGKIWSWVAV